MNDPLEGSISKVERSTEKRTLDVIVALLLVIGGLNWGPVGFLEFDLVAAVLGQKSALSNTVYGLVGICALYQALQFKSIQRHWSLATEAR